MAEVAPASSGGGGDPGGDFGGGLGPDDGSAPPFPVDFNPGDGGLIAIDPGAQ